MLLIFFQSCKTLNELKDSLSSLQKLEFKLDNVNQFNLAGINVSNIGSASDLSLTDGLKLSRAFATKKFPASFTLNVAAKNPNDGSGKTKKATATLTSLDWKLYIDGKETIAGVVNESITIPATGATETIPLQINLDLYEFFGNKGYDKILDLALAIGGADGSASRLKLDAKPTVSTQFGNISYPGRITIVDKNWTN